VLVVLGASILLPFEGWKMLVLGLLCAAFHVVFTLDFPLQQNLPVLMATLSAVAIAVVGSHELTRSRRADFEGRRAKEALLRAREDFVAMVTHDIRNPLATVDGFVEMLRDHAGTTPDDREALLTGVQRAVRTAVALAGNFLDASKIEAGRFVVKTGATDVAELVARALANQRPHALHKGVALRNDTAADLPPVDADGAALDRVFANLIGNAIKHTPAGGTVSVAARHANGGIEIVVEDTGSGIPVGEEARIFERYTSAASRADSTGLGLFIVHTITAAHGGTIVASNHPDGGAVFRFSLPGTAA
jgi:signal transduction histidine kinase